MVKQFKGEVKISDVQAEFDALVGRINKMVDAYNGTNQVITNIDYTKGGSNLAPSGYTLTVGGIKQALKSLDGHVVGGKCFYNTANTVKMSDGLLFTKGGVFRLPDSILTKPSNGNSIWFDTNKGEYVWGQKRVSGRQTLTEEGATSLVKSGEGYKNSSYKDINATPSSAPIEEKIENYTKSNTDYWPVVGIKQSGLSEIRDIGTVDSEPLDRIYLKSVKWKNFDLRKFPHKSIPLESTEVEFDIMRSGILTESESTWSYSGSPNCYAILGYYQDNTFTPYICLSAYHDGISPYVPQAAVPNIANVSLYPDSSIDAQTIPLSKHEVITQTQRPDITHGDLYYCEKYALGAWATNNTKEYITDNINKPEGVDTGKHIISGVKFKLYHPSPYANATEKATPENLNGKLVCQMDAIDKDGTIVKYWDIYTSKGLDSNSSQVTVSGIMSHPLFMELWTADKTDGELGSSREKYMAENSPLGKCNMILYGTSETISKDITGYNDIVFKQSEYNPTFNVTTGTYEVWDAKGKPDPDCYHITDYATARDSDYRNDLKNLQVQDLDGTFKITVKNRLFNGIAAAGSSQAIDTSSKAKFVCAGDVIRTEGQGVASISLLGTEVSYNSMAGHKKLCYWYPCNYLYLPKGVGSPYSETNGRPSLMCQFPFDVNVEKDLS